MQALLPGLPVPWTKGPQGSLVRLQRAEGQNRNSILDEHAQPSLQRTPLLKRAPEYRVAGTFCLRSLVFGRFGAGLTNDLSRWCCGLRVCPDSFVILIWISDPTSQRLDVGHRGLGRLELCGLPLKPTQGLNGPPGTVICLFKPGVLFISASPCCLDGGDVDLAHCHHGREGAL
jgi:hypothetical protein